jgi:small-conductance mechanosensitive channel
METLVDFLRTQFDLPTVVQRQLLESIGLVLVLIVLRFVIVRLINRRTEEISTRYLWRKWLNNGLAVVGVFLLVRIWIDQVGSLATYLGIATAGLAIALRDPIVNVAAWSYIISQRPFQLGDRIEVFGTKGDVVDTNIFQFTLLEIGNWVDADQNTGRLVHVPNAVVFSNLIANWTEDFPYIWHEMPVLITFESDWEKAKQLLQTLLDKHIVDVVADAKAHSQKYTGRLMIRYGTLTPIVYTSVSSSGVLLTMRFLCRPRTRRGISEKLWEDLLRAFAAAPDIELAYDTQRVLASWNETSAASQPRPRGKVSGFDGS